MVVKINQALGRLRANQSILDLLENERSLVVVLGSVSREIRLGLGDLCVVAPTVEPGQRDGELCHVGIAIARPVRHEHVARAEVIVGCVGFLGEPRANLPLLHAGRGHC